MSVDISVTEFYYASQADDGTIVKQMISQEKVTWGNTDLHEIKCDLLNAT